MGHDITGFNEIGEEVAYARFSFVNENAAILYQILDVPEYNAGVSGGGYISTFSLTQIKESLKRYKRTYNKDPSIPVSDDPKFMDQRQIQRFIHNCLVTAKKEGRVKVTFC